MGKWDGGADGSAPRTRTGFVAPFAAVVAVVAAVVLTGCGTDADREQASSSTSVTPSGGVTPKPSEGARGSARTDNPTPVADPEHAVDAPGRLADPVVGADLLVSGRAPLTEKAVRAVAATKGVEVVDRISVAQVPAEDQVLTVAAVDPATYRRFTPDASAQLQDIWTRVAGGEVAVVSRLGKRLQDADGYLRLGNGRTAPRLHVGALAPQAPRIDAVVNAKWGETLGIPQGNALLISTGTTAPQVVQEALRRIFGSRASVQVLGPDLDTSVQQTAYLTGTPVAQAVGSFSYRVLGGGRVAPDPAWVRANIVTGQVPILGSVTCHKVIFPQLRAALAEVVARGLADKINPGEYAGCYYPRFIAGSTSLSLHSFGIALDLNVPGNQRGTVGDIDRSVVQIFKKWGFAWGGDWSYTDPMHFEMNRVVAPR